MNIHKRYFLISCVSGIIIGISGYVLHGLYFPGGTFPLISFIISLPFWSIAYISPVYFLARSDFIENRLGLFLFIALLWIVIFYIYLKKQEKLLLNSALGKIKGFTGYLPLLFAVIILLVSLFTYVTYDTTVIPKCMDRVGETPQSCIKDIISHKLMGTGWSRGRVFDIKKYEAAILFCNKVPTEWRKDILPSETNYKDYCFLKLAETVLDDISSTEASHRSRGSRDEAIEEFYASPLFQNAADQLCKESGKVSGDKKYQECIHYIDSYYQRMITYDTTRITECQDRARETLLSCFEHEIRNKLVGPVWSRGSVFDIKKYEAAIHLCKKLPTDKMIQETTWRKDILPSETNYKDYCFLKLAETVLDNISNEEALSRLNGSYYEAIKEIYASPLLQNAADQLCKESGKVSGDKKYQECINYIDSYNQRMLAERTRT